jgi:hypothetical protein
MDITNAAVNKREKNRVGTIKLKKTEGLKEWVCQS